MKPTFLFTAVCLVAGWTLAASVSAQYSATAPLQITPTTVDPSALTFAIGKAAKFSTAVNGRSHQQTPITSFGGWQYATYFNAQRKVCVGRRKLPQGDWEVICFDDHRIKSNDSHNTAVIGICHADGTIHLAFDHHATPLNYRISKLGVATDPDAVTWNTDLFGGIQHSLGSIATDPRVTYPRFFNAPDGNLMLFYRGGTSGNGDGNLHQYDGTKHQWTPGLGTVISRDIGDYTVNGLTSELRCPYMNDVSYAGKRLHASWVWRDRFERTNPANQHDLCYIFSDDDGRTWHRSDGKQIGRTAKELIHLNTPGLIVKPIPTESRVTNQNTQYAYPDGSVHIVNAYRPEASLPRQYQHNWRDAEGNWHHQSIPFYGKRPKLLGDENRALLLVYNDGDEKLTIIKGTPNAQQTAWTWTQIPHDFDTFISGEPVVDYQRWQQEAILSIYCQQEPQQKIETDSADPVDGFPAPLLVLDADLSDEFSVGDHSEN